MSMRKSLNGRPTGTDGSDFSYRMVVDSRYKKVARGRSHLSAVIFTQIIKDLSRWEVSRLEVLKIASVVLGFLTQIYAMRATTALIHNMAPPKRTS